MNSDWAGFFHREKEEKKGPGRFFHDNYEPVLCRCTFRFAFFCIIFVHDYCLAWLPE